MDLMEDEKDEDLTYLTFVNHKNGDGVQILYRSYSCKESLWLYQLFFIAYKTQKLLIISKNAFISIIFE